MPIKGLSDIRRITRGGHIRLGERVERTRDGKTVTYPQKSDHFIADFDDPEMESLFYKIYGDKPTVIRVAFPSDNADNFFQQWYKCYGSTSGLKCKGDGEIAQRIVDNEMVELPCPSPDECDFAQANGCKRIASLQCFIKGLPGLNVFQVNTSSFNSIVNLNSGIDMLRWARGGRTISGVWVDLILKEQQAQATVKGKQQAVTIYVMELKIPVSLDNVNQLVSCVEAPAMLPPPDDKRDEYLQPVNGFAPDPDPEPAPEPVKAEPSNGSLETDPDVVAAFSMAKTSDVKKRALLVSATENGWSKGKLIEKVLGKNGSQKVPAPAPASATAKQADIADDF